MTKVTTHLDLLNELVGEKGSASRERFEAELRAEILAAKIKEMRLKKHLTQEQLGVLVGKDRTQISKIEKGRNLTISSIVQIVEALGGKVNFDIQFT